MKKKTITIIIILVLAVCVASGVYYFTQRDGSVGINENITNEDNKTASIDMDGKYPMWWYTLPMIMYTFFDEYDFAGKTIIPFNTHEGSGDGGTYETIKEFEPDATVLDGLAIRGGDMQSDQTSEVKAWLQEIGFGN